MAIASARIVINPAGVSATIQDAGTRAVTRLARRVVASAKMRAPVDTGNLRAQINSGPVTRSGTVIRQEVSVTGSAAEYALYVHEGTRPHVIRPRNASVLAFPGAQGRVFAAKVNHPGMRARPYLRNALNAEAPALGFNVSN